MSISSIKFPPSTITPKLSSRFLKKLATQQDWVHQTYSGMIQDVHYATNHYYELKESGASSLLSASLSNQQSFTPESDNTKTQSIKVSKEEKITDPSYISNYTRDSSTSNKAIHTFHFFSIKDVPPANLYKKDDDINSVQENNEIEEDDSDSDSQSEFCNTYTTSSTDCNRRNNIFKFYREQQNIERPIDEEEDTDTVIKIVTPQNHSLYNAANTSDSTLPSLINNNDSNSSLNNTQHAKNTKLKQQQEYKRVNVTRGKNVKLFKSILARMRIAAEKPFWAINRHF